MKRMICIILLLGMILSGCGVNGDRVKDPVVFYYVRDNYQKDMGAVFDSEVREAAGHTKDLAYLLALYTMGPSKEELHSPLPRGTTVTPGELTAEGVILTLSEHAVNMAEAEYTLASACLGMTVMELMEVPSVTVICGDRSITINGDNLVLQDPSPAKPIGGK